MGSSARAGVNVEFRATGVDAVRRNLRLVRDEGEGAGRETARGLRGMAGALADVAREGALGARPLKEIVKSGAELAISFGAGGPILGAIGLFGLVLFNTFDRAREQIVETRKLAIQELNTIATNADPLEALKKQQQTLQRCGARHAAAPGREHRSVPATHGRARWCAGTRGGDRERTPAGVHPARRLLHQQAQCPARCAVRCGDLRRAHAGDCALQESA
jgi:hypothetical protein